MIGQEAASSSISGRGLDNPDSSSHTPLPRLESGRSPTLGSLSRRLPRVEQQHTTHNDRNRASARAHGPRPRLRHSPAQASPPSIHQRPGRRVLSSCVPFPPPVDEPRAHGTTLRVCCCRVRAVLSQGTACPSPLFAFVPAVGAVRRPRLQPPTESLGEASEWWCWEGRTDANGRGPRVFAPLWAGYRRPAAATGRTSTGMPFLWMAVKARWGPCCGWWVAGWSTHAHERRTLAMTAMLAAR